MSQQDARARNCGLTHSEVCRRHVKQELKKDPGMGADELANALVKRAIRFRTQDNVAVVVVDLRQATS